MTEGIMHTIDFIRRKNEIIEEYTGIVLVPEDQIEDVEIRPLDIDQDANACPYCVFHKDDCDECIMSQKGNDCGDETSTYVQVLEALEDNIDHDYGSIVDIPEIIELVAEFNSRR